MTASNDHNFLFILSLDSLDGFSESVPLQHVVRANHVFASISQRWEPVGIEVRM